MKNWLIVYFEQLGTFQKLEAKSNLQEKRQILEVYFGPLWSFPLHMHLTNFHIYSYYIDDHSLKEVGDDI